MKRSTSRGEQAKAPAFFLDRDGTINVDHVYISDPLKIELIPGAAAAIRRANDAGFKVAVASNQSGIGRGLIDAAKMPEIHARLDELLAGEAGAKIDAYEFCPHHPDDSCACRKPGTKLVTEAAERLGIALERSFFVGDSWVDVECGRAAGLKSILVRTGKGTETEFSSHLKNAPDHVAADLAAAVAWALKN